MAKEYTRAEFLVRARELLTEMEQDHEDCTGIPADEKMPLAEWLDDMQNCEDNS